MEAEREREREGGRDGAVSCYIYRWNRLPAQSVSQSPPTMEDKITIWHQIVTDNPVTNTGLCKNTYNLPKGDLQINTQTLKPYQAIFKTRKYNHEDCNKTLSDPEEERKRKQAMKAYNQRYKRHEEKRDRSNVSLFLKFNQKDGRILCQTQIKTKETDSGILSKEIKTQQPLCYIYKTNGGGGGRGGGQQQKRQKIGKRKYMYEEADDDTADED